MTALPRDDNGEAMLVYRPVPGATEKVASGSATTRTFPNGSIVRVILTAAGTVRFAASGTAASGTSDVYLPANLPEYFKTGPLDYIGVLCTGGSAYITLMG